MSGSARWRSADAALALARLLGCGSSGPPARHPSGIRRRHAARWSGVVSPSAAALTWRNSYAPHRRTGAYAASEQAMANDRQMAEPSRGWEVISRLSRARLPPYGSRYTARAFSLRSSAQVGGQAHGEGVVGRVEVPVRIVGGEHEHLVAAEHLQQLRRLRVAPAPPSAGW